MIGEVFIFPIFFFPALHIPNLYLSLTESRGRCTIFEQNHIQLV